MKIILLIFSFFTLKCSIAQSGQYIEFKKIGNVDAIFYPVYIINEDVPINKAEVIKYGYLDFVPKLVFEKVSEYTKGKSCETCEFITRDYLIFEVRMVSNDGTVINRRLVSDDHSKTFFTGLIQLLEGYYYCDLPNYLRNMIN